MRDVITKITQLIVASFFRPASTDLVVPYSLFPAAHPNPNPSPPLGAISSIANDISAHEKSIIISSKVVME